MSLPRAAVPKFSQSGGTAARKRPQLNSPIQPPRFRLTDQTVQIWSVRLSQTVDESQSFRGWLSDAERRRAVSFRFDVHRDRFIAARGALRQVLAGYLNCGPSDVEFGYGKYGKPELAVRPSGLPLEFNLSHAQDEALIAVTIGHRVGVDLEQIRPLNDMFGVARASFSLAECKALARLEASEQLHAFFRAWTRKEALLKALGTGFSVSSQEFEVSLGPLEPARLISVPAGAPPPSGWSLLDLNVAQGFLAAVAVDSPQVRVEMLDLGQP
jgi:4'-phosphopantetheinyl transferase